MLFYSIISNVLLTEFVSKREIASTKENAIL